MAELVLMSLASKILLTLASPAFIKAYASIWGARNDLEDLQGSIKLIHAKLEDAHINQDSPAIEKAWMERIGDLLHEADDLFDEVASDELLKQQTTGSVLKKVYASFSRQNPVISNIMISIRLKGIKRRFQSISSVTTQLMLLPNQNEEPKKSVGNEVVWTGPDIINPEGIVGREEELASIRRLLLSDNKRNIIALVGIAGLGKTTLAQLIYNDEAVQDKFRKRWWACISNTTGKKQVLERIFQSIKGESHCGGINMLEYEISKLVMKTRENPKNYLLILDDVWDDDLSIWFDVMSLLTSGSKGSKIVVTTRYTSVAWAMGAEAFTLEGLSSQDSFRLFKMIAFREGEENDLRRIRLGEEIVVKCLDVPLAIKSIATLLLSRPDIQDWRSVRDDPNLQYEGNDSFMHRLRVTFNHLPSDIKLCFAYCSVFPRQYKIVKKELVYLWIAQGYVKPRNNESVEAAGNGYFKELLRLFFFQEAEKDMHGEIITCKVHNLFHQLAQDVAGDQSVILSRECTQYLHRRTLHLTVGYEMDDSWTIPESMLIAQRLRSSLFMYRGSLSAPTLDRLFTEFKFLRALDLEDLGVEKVPNSIGELKHLRYLNLSENTFKGLPSSMTKLVNLVALDISGCKELKALPYGFRKLINLRFLNAQGCYSLMLMPPKFEELECMEYLSYFNATNNPRPNERGRLPTALPVLKLENPTMEMPNWNIPSLLPKLVKLHLFNSVTIEHLPPLRCLSCLKDLRLSNLDKLRYVEESKERQFFPCLEILTLEELPILEGWSMEVARIRASQDREAIEEQMPRFNSLLTLKIHYCPKLKSMPLLIGYETIELRSVPDELARQLEQT